jgi:hypothetical protein
MIEKMQLFQEKEFRITIIWQHVIQGVLRAIPRLPKAPCFHRFSRTPTSRVSCLHELLKLQFHCIGIIIATRTTEYLVLASVFSYI